MLETENQDLKIDDIENLFYKYGLILDNDPKHIYNSKRKKQKLSVNFVRIFITIR